ncbi:MAG: cellulase family glycosylhydrolase, partial [Chloroflexi bacterium]|nr:cellulase family glycosylhydrolase [Chloroflexota bacterium]
MQEARFAAVAATSPHLAPRLALADDTPVAHTGINPFGINTFFDQEPDLARLEASMRLLADAGFGWIRQQFPWADIEQPAKGQHWDTRWNTSSWEKYDRIIALARRNGVQVIARLDYPPAWARSNQRWPAGPPDRYEDFGDFVATVVARYRGQVRYFQIWNEPNLTIEWGRESPSAADYVRLLRIAYQRAKAANPDAVILAAALAPTIEEGPENISDLTFLRQMYALGARPYFDIASFNPYGLRSGPHDRRARASDTNVSRVLLARAIMVEHGDAAKPIWAG